MSAQLQSLNVPKLLRAFACSVAIVGPYLYTIIEPEKTLDYRFIRTKDEDEKFLRAHPSYNRIATEMALRMQIHKQMYRTTNIDIRSMVHDGLDFDSNGNFTPAFNGIVYVCIPHWANLSSVDDLKKLKINYAGQEIDFSKINYSMLDMKKINIGDQPEKKVPIVQEDFKEPEQKSKSYFSRWFGKEPILKVPEPIIEQSQETSLIRDDTPASREALLLERLIETFNLSDNAKRYIIADQIELGRGPWHVLPWFIVVGSFFLPFSLYTRFRSKLQTRFKRFMFFHFLLLNGALCFYFSPFLGRLVNMQVSRIRDSGTAAYGLDLVEGGIEFLEKQVERNRILRELLPKGKNLFDPDGERTSTRIELPHTRGLAVTLHHWYPLIHYRLKRLRKKLDSILSLPENEARKEIFKDSN